MMDMARWTRLSEQFNVEDWVALALDWETVTRDFGTAWRDFGLAVRRTQEEMRQFVAEMNAITPRRRRSGHKHRGTRAWARRYYVRG